MVIEGERMQGKGRIYKSVAYRIVTFQMLRVSASIKHEYPQCWLNVTSMKYFRLKYRCIYQLFFSFEMERSDSYVTDFSSIITDIYLLVLRVF